jgi:beta-xylosidase
VQPTSSSIYDWSALLDLEVELISAQAANLTPIVIVSDSPNWATKTYYDADGQPYQTSCGAIRTEHFADFAQFMQALVARYGKPPYNVRFWELGNEPDIDPRLVAQDNIFGCWGDASDPYYGGEHYGEMLKVVTPAIKAVDPSAQVLVGGLILDNPGTGAAEQDTSSNFLEGILRAGAGDSFDILPYHAYAYYAGRAVDSDLTHLTWSDWGGATLGKAKFLREVMARYGVDKPLSLNETGLLFGGDEFDPAYLQAQADYIVRILARSMSTNLHSVFWYTLNGPGWRSAGLLDETQTPRPSYFAYQHLIKQVSMTRTVTAISDYGTGVEAYRFARSNGLVDLLWAREAPQQTIQVPRSQVITIYDRDGAVIAPSIVGDQVRLEVGVSPIYIKRAP